MIKQTDNSYPLFISTVMKVILNYLRYTQMVWMIIFWAMFLFIFFLTMIFVVISSRPELLTDALNYIIRLLNIRDLHINTILGKDEILWAYGLISMVVYAFASLIKFLFNIKYSPSFKEKIIFLLVIIVGMSVLMFVFISFAFFVSNDQIYAGYYGFIPLFALGTFITSLYYLIVSKVIDFIIKTIDYNLNRSIS